MEMRDLDELFAALGRSAFRSRFRLGRRERDYLRARGLPAVMEHAAAFIAERLAPAEPANDGKQTPMRNHPVFVAQHATATCCRGCLEKWHRIPRGTALDDERQRHVLAVLERWLVAADPADAPRTVAPPDTRRTTGRSDAPGAVDRSDAPRPVGRSDASRTGSRSDGPRSKGPSVEPPELDLFDAL